MGQVQNLDSRLKLDPGLIMFAKAVCYGGGGGGGGGVPLC